MIINCMLFQERMNYLNKLISYLKSVFSKKNDVDFQLHKAWVDLE